VPSSSWLRLVYVAPVTDPQHLDRRALVIYRIDNSVVPNPEPPLVLPSLQFNASMRSRLVLKLLNPVHQAMHDAIRKPLDLLQRARFQRNFVPRHEAFCAEPSPLELPLAARSLRSCGTGLRANPGNLPTATHASEDRFEPRRACPCRQLRIEHQSEPFTRSTEISSR